MNAIITQILYFLNFINYLSYAQFADFTSKKDTYFSTTHRVEPLFSGHPWNHKERPVKRGVLISEVDLYTFIDSHDSGYLGMVVQLYVQAHLGHYHILTQKEYS